MMIAMSVINLINAEQLNKQLLRILIKTLYFSIIIDVLFLVVSNKDDQILTG